MDPSHERHVRFHAFLYGVRADSATTRVVVTTTEPAPQSKTPAGQNDEASAELVAQMMQQNATLLEHICESIQDFDVARRRSLMELQQVAVELSMVVAAHVIQKHISEDADAISTLVQQAIDRLGGTGPLTMHLNPEDLTRLNSMWESSGAARPDNIRFAPDQSLTTGSCFAESCDFGLLSTVDARLAEIRQALLEGIDDAQTERRNTDEKNRTVRRFPDRRETA